MSDFQNPARGQTPSQTIGPFFAYGLTPAQYGYGHLTAIATGSLIGEGVEGQRITLAGRVLDGAGEAISDAMVEIWQADSQGRYSHPADPGGRNAPFVGFGRVGTGTDPGARFLFETIQPGAVPGDADQAPHINVILFARGLLNHLYTRVYFADQAAANAQDPVLAALPEDRRGTLIAERVETPAGVEYRWDIHLQGDKETVFFDL
ncbi:MAG: protocatechuate 3,4-dioxygenase subunit alpha [Alphaproteobacteria bacterium]|nr:protocatechuate 3,4-dioxygenase subunit alpha [Alphaproteobacteria bacterium]